MKTQPTQYTDEQANNNTEDFILSDEKLSKIILEFTYEAGVRKLKEKLQEIIRVKHVERLESGLINFDNEIKTKIKNKDINDIFENNHKVNFKKIRDEPRVGYINGMFATAAGIGGITIIQVQPMYHKEIFGVQITGSVEKVMNESVQVAKTVAYNLLSKKEKTQLVNDFKDTGLHVHFPDGATPKDGPSGGTAITCAIYSTFVNRPIRNDIAITGEIDLDGNVTIIGGLDAKLSGAKRAGVILALVPQENMRDVEIIKRKDPQLINNNFKVKFVSHISEVVEYIF
jgi:ATP-dependent Lon protease